MPLVYLFHVAIFAVNDFRTLRRIRRLDLLLTFTTRTIKKSIRIPQRHPPLMSFRWMRSREREIHTPIEIEFLFDDAKRLTGNGTPDRPVEDIVRYIGDCIR